MGAGELRRRFPLAGRLPSGSSGEGFADRSMSLSSVSSPWILNGVLSRVHRQL
jgi:hypothetical protein